MKTPWSGRLSHRLHWRLQRAMDTTRNLLYFIDRTRSHLETLEFDP